MNSAFTPPVSEKNKENIPRIWLYNDLVKCGFPSPAEGYADREIDFNSYIIEKPFSSFCFFVRGDSMEGAHILEGDLVVVDRSRPLKNGRIIICCLEGQFTIKRFSKTSRGCFLLPANPEYKPVRLEKESSFEYWGTVTCVVRKNV